MKTDQTHDKLLEIHNSIEISLGIMTNSFWLLEVEIRKKICYNKLVILYVQNWQIAHIYSNDSVYFN